jgi:hypothetical protein
MANGNTLSKESDSQKNEMGKGERGWRDFIIFI